MGYVRAESRGAVKVTYVNEQAQNRLKLTTLPCLLRAGIDDEKTTSPFSIAREVSKACYLEEIMVRKVDSQERDEVSMFCEMAMGQSEADLSTAVDKHMGMRMFLVGKQVSFADIIVFASLASHWSKMDDREKATLPNTFRWIDHI